MLDKLLELLRAGGTRRVADLARELDTTPAMVEMMLEDLARLGYVEQAGAGCGGACAGCGALTRCTLARS